MKQETHVLPESFQTITTLETECCRCHAVTRHVAHATNNPPFDKGIVFPHSGPSKGMSFLDYERIIQKQADYMGEMSRRHESHVAMLQQTINSLAEALELIREQHTIA